MLFRSHRPSIPDDRCMAAPVTERMPRARAYPWRGDVMPWILALYALVCILAGLLVGWISGAMDYWYVYVLLMLFIGTASVLIGRIGSKR